MITTFYLLNVTVHGLHFESVLEDKNNLFSRPSTLWSSCSTQISNVSVASASRECQQGGPYIVGGPRRGELGGAK